MSVFAGKKANRENERMKDTYRERKREREKMREREKLSNEI